MLAFLAHPLFRDAVLGVALLALLGSAWGYHRWSSATMAALRANLVLVQQQADALAAAKARFESEVAAIKAAQDAANGDIARARDLAAQASRGLRAAQAQMAARAKADPHALQKQVNQDQADRLQGLEALSH